MYKVEINYKNRKRKVIYTKNNKELFISGKKNNVATIIVKNVKSEV